MHYDQRKVVLIGTGMVGTSYAYALLNQGICNELVLIDLNAQRAMGEAMDLSHGLAFSSSHMRINAGTYADCADADLVVICAGVNQKPGESRLDLLQRNAEVFQSIVEPVVASGFSGIFLVATNPVDIMARIVQQLSGFPAGRVMGSGTTLDTARLRYLLGEYFEVDPRNVHAYVCGEHGDSEFVPWSQAMVGTKPVLDLCVETQRSFDDLEKITEQVRGSAQVIIKAKQATYYGIGMSLARITRAIFSDENSILTVSSQTNGEYGLHDLFIGLPTLVNRQGVRKIIQLNLTPRELEILRGSAETLEESYRQLRL